MRKCLLGERGGAADGDRAGAGAAGRLDAGNFSDVLMQMEGVERERSSALCLLSTTSPWKPRSGAVWGNAART